MIKVIGVDVGYGHTKAVVDGKPTIFPSLVGPARVLSFRLTDAKDLPGEDITIQGKSFFVGKKAELCDTIFSMHTRDWIESDIFSALLSSALTRAINYDVKNIETIIVSGLPVEYFARDKKAMEDRVRLVAGDLGIKLAGVKIVPQPIGTFYDFLINMDGTATGEHCYRLAGVVDIGMHTTDFLLIKDMNDNLERASGSLTGGVFGIIESVRRSIVGKYDRDSVTIEEAENCVVRKQPIKIKGKTIKVSDIVNSHMSSTAQTIVGVIKSSWSYMGEPDLVILTGGGCVLLKNHLRGLAQATHLIEGAQLANVRGYAKIGELVRESISRGHSERGREGKTF